MAMLVQDDEPLEACYFEVVPVDTYDKDTGRTQTHKVLRMVRAQIIERDEKTEVCTLVVRYPDRRMTRAGVAYGPGKPGRWGWPNDRGE